MNTADALTKMIELIDKASNDLGLEHAELQNIRATLALLFSDFDVETFKYTQKRLLAILKKEKISINRPEKRARD